MSRVRKGSLCYANKLLLKIRAACHRSQPRDDRAVSLSPTPPPPPGSGAGRGAGGWTMAHGWGSNGSKEAATKTQKEEARRAQGWRPELCGPVPGSPHCSRLVLPELCTFSMNWWSSKWNVSLSSVSHSSKWIRPNTGSLEPSIYSWWVRSAGDNVDLQTASRAGVGGSPARLSPSAVESEAMCWRLRIDCWGGSPRAHIGLDLRTSSYWVSMGPESNKTDTLMGRGERRRDRCTAKRAMWHQRQRLEWPATSQGPPRAAGDRKLDPARSPWKPPFLRTPGFLGEPAAPTAPGPTQDESSHSAVLAKLLLSRHKTLLSSNLRLVVLGPRETEFWRERVGRVNAISYFAP